MRYYSTRNKNNPVNFAEAALSGLAPDGGLFVPQEIPRYSRAALLSLGTMDYPDIAFETIKPYVQDDIPDSTLQDIVRSAYTFNAPLAGVGDRHVLELFHGPTAAFKDFGARFMARTFSYLRRGEDKPLHILVATSGDTGGAVADGFFEVPGIFVTVMYPKGRITPLQERQIAGLGGNISALAVEGSFDDCQRLAKAALADEDLKKKTALSSANSINISRLIPQAAYYTAGSAAACGGGAGITMCVPSGNFGNLTAGLYAMKMGAPIMAFIAATNINKTFPDYLSTGEYRTRVSQATISNAMDVGAPSNFERMAAHFSLDEMRRLILGVSVSDGETRETIVKVHNETGYFLDPHSAVGWKGVDILLAKNNVNSRLLSEGPVGVLSTAHPAKFAETVEPLIGPVPVPESIARAMRRSVQSHTIPAHVSALLDILKKEAK
jgi:threonine synthase